MIKNNLGVSVYKHFFMDKINNSKQQKDNKKVGILEG